MKLGINLGVTVFNLNLFLTCIIYNLKFWGIKVYTVVAYGKRSVS